MTNLFSHFLTLFWANPLAQTLGLIATVIVAISFSCTDDRRFRTMMIVGQCIFIVHFILLGAFAGALSFGLAASRTIWSTFISRDRSVYGIFLCLYLLAGYFRVDVWYDVLPLLG